MAHPRSRLAIAAIALTLAALSGATILTAGGVATAAAAPATAPATAEATPPAPTFAEVSVHDPSVVTSGEDIWVFGSHGASAHTTDLMNWTQHTVDLGISRDNALFEDIDTEGEEFALVMVRRVEGKVVVLGEIADLPLVEKAAKKLVA